MKMDTDIYYITFLHNIAYFTFLFFPTDSLSYRTKCVFSPTNWTNKIVDGWRWKNR